MTPGVSRVGAHATPAAHTAAAAAQSFATDDTAVEVTASRLTVGTTHRTLRVAIGENRRSSLVRRNAESVTLHTPDRCGFVRTRRSFAELSRTVRGSPETKSFKKQ